MVEIYIEVTALVGPIDPPYQIHTPGEDGAEDTPHSELVQRPFDAIDAIAPGANVSATVLGVLLLPDGVRVPSGG